MQQRLVVLLALVFPLLAACQPASQSGATSESAYIEVQGTGVALAVPDRVSMVFVIEADGEDLVQLKQQVDRTTVSMLDLFTELDIPRQQIRSWQVSVQPEYHYHERERIFVGYSVSRDLQVTFDDIDRFDEILNSALQAGIGNLSRVNFSVAEPAPFHAEARAAAIDHARAKAEQMATLSGRKLGPALQIREQGGHQERILVTGSRMLAADSSATEAGEQEIRAQVFIRFALID